MDSVLAFVAVAAILSVTPGAATALVVRSALRGGTREALTTIAGNAVGVLAWALLSAVGVAAVVAASQVAFEALRIAGSVVLVVLGAQALWRARKGAPRAAEGVPRERVASRRAFRDAVLTSLANPKLSVFFVALFPQFVPDGAPVLPLTLLMGLLVVSIDFAWYSLLAVLVTRAQRALRPTFERRLEQLTGTVLVGLGVRLALEHRR